MSKKNTFATISMKHDGNSVGLHCECGTISEVESFRDWNTFVECPDCHSLYEMFVSVKPQKLDEMPRIYDLYPQVGKKKFPREPKDYTISGVILEDIPNSNLTQNIKAQLDEQMVEHRAFAVLHQDGATVDLAGVAGVVESCHFDDDGSLVGKVKLLDTPNGQLVKRIIDASNKKFTIHANMYGTINEETRVINDDAELISVTVRPSEEDEG